MVGESSPMIDELFMAILSHKLTANLAYRYIRAKEEIINGRKWRKEYVRLVFSRYVSLSIQYVHHDFPIAPPGA